MLRSPYRDEASPHVLEALEPLVNRAADRLRSVTARIGAGFGQTVPWQAVIESRSAALASRLFSLLRMAIKAELHIARVRGRHVGEGCFGLEKYPVLDRQISLASDQWVASGREFFVRLERDWPSIRRVFALTCKLDSLRRVIETGDRHAGGRAVLVLEFEAGEKLLYKPRSLAPEAHFQQLLLWLNEHGATPAFRPLQILNREEYGWMEYATPEACSDATEVRSFHERCGAQLALLHVLLATDMHHENVIAMGEHPVLIDLETVFHPSLGPRAEPHVCRTGFVPRPAAEQRVDCSGLNGRGPATSASFCRDTESGCWRLASPQQSTPLHRPRLGDRSVRTEAYRSRICQGFASTYRLLCRNRQALTRCSGPLARFEQDSVRVVLRSTHAYSTLRRSAYHPNLMRDHGKWDEWFGCLQRGADAWRDSRRVIDAERRSLQQGDIPRFTSRPASRDLYLGESDRIVNFFAEPAAAQVARHLDKLNQRDLHECLRAIRIALPPGSPAGNVVRN